MISVLVAALVVPILVDISLVRSEFVHPGFDPWAAGWTAVVFGTGGTLIIISVLLTCWFWAQAHARPRLATQHEADLRLLAYVLFGMAAYWT